MGSGYCSAKWTCNHHEKCHKGEKGKVVKEAEALLRYAESENLPLSSDTVTKLGQVYAKRVDDPVLQIARNIASAQPAQEERKRKDQRVYDECREEARLTFLAAGFQEEDDDDSASSSPRKKARMQSSNESGEAEWTY